MTGDKIQDSGFVLKFEVFEWFLIIMQLYSSKMTAHKKTNNKKRNVQRVRGRLLCIYLWWYMKI